jgi:glycosyltransferase involved in cell wall biosynthesis
VPLKFNYKILILRSSNFHGGPEKQITHHARLCRESEFDVTIASFTEDETVPEFINHAAAQGISTHVFNVHHAYDMNSIRLLRDYLLEHRIDLLCTHDYRSNIIAAWATVNTGCKWMAFSRGWTYETFKIFLYHMLDSMIIRVADSIVAVSHSQKKKLRRFLINHSKIHVVENAIDLEELSKVASVDIRQRYALPPGSIVIASAGRFSREKGQTYLVHAAMELSDGHPDLYFVLFGDGPGLERLKQLVYSRALAHRILFPGFVSDVLSCLKGGVDIIINPSLSEAMPNIVLEALGLQIPVIATAVGGVPEIIENGKSGYLIPPKSPKAIADKITGLIEDKTLCRAFMSGGKTVVDTRFSFQHQYSKLNTLYHQLLDN